MNHLGIWVIWEDAALQIFWTTTDPETTRPQIYQDDWNTTERDLGQTNSNVRDDQAKTGIKEHVGHENEEQTRDEDQASGEEHVGNEDEEQTKDELQAGDKAPAGDQIQAGDEEQTRHEE
jgi:hypothetical protein